MRIYHLKFISFVVGASLLTLSFVVVLTGLFRPSIVSLMGSRNVSEVVQPGENTILFEPSLSDYGVDSFAIILVTSIPSAFRQRQAVRSTWGKWAEEASLRVIFTIGFHDLDNDALLQDLAEEHNIYDDLLVDYFQEGYYRLAGKMLRMLKWVVATFSEDGGNLPPTFLIKTDHDVFLNLPKIVNILKKTQYFQSITASQSRLELDADNPGSYIVGGKVFQNAEVDSSLFSKWSISQAEREELHWHESFFPPYANGPFYVISGNAVRPIYEASYSVPLFPFEDIYLTGMVAHDYLGLTISHLEGMSSDSTNDNKWTWEMVPSLLYIHPVQTPELMVEICERLESCSKLSKI